MIDWGIDTRTVTLGPHPARHCTLCGRERPFVLVLTYRVFRILYVIRFSYEKVYTSECVQCGGGAMELHEDEVVPTLRNHPVRFLDRFGGYAAIAVTALILAAVLLRNALR
ncbi:MAG TPA: hypothetical protein VEX35_10420 [Allosphingosinicella sp.]|nr:hypothetical protein [Allosphingosinicella sp.]